MLMRIYSDQYEEKWYRLNDVKLHVLQADDRLPKENVRETHCHKILLVTLTTRLPSSLIDRDQRIDSEIASRII